MRYHKSYVTIDLSYKVREITYIGKEKTAQAIGWGVIPFFVMRNIGGYYKTK